jgi:hypothetical protein
MGILRGLKGCSLDKDEMIWSGLVRSVMNIFLSFHGLFTISCPVSRVSSLYDFCTVKRWTPGKIEKQFILCNYNHILHKSDYY